MAEQTIAFGFEKPSHRASKACQLIDMTFLDPLEADSEETVRGFSIGSSPYEKTRMVVTPMCDTAFKRVLNRMPFGTAIKIKHVETAAAK